MASLLALAGALGWGVGDFLGGVAARRLAVLTVLAISQAVGLVGVGLWVLVSGDAFPGFAQLLPAAAGGIAALVGLGALYRGFAIGAMGIVAPISAAAPIVPLARRCRTWGESQPRSSGSVSSSSSRASSLSHVSRAARAGAASPPELGLQPLQHLASGSSFSGSTRGPTRARPGR